MRSCRGALPLARAAAENDTWGYLPHCLNSMHVHMGAFAPQDSHVSMPMSSTYSVKPPVVPLHDDPHNQGAILLSSVGVYSPYCPNIIRELAFRLHPKSTSSKGEQAPKARLPP